MSKGMYKTAEYRSWRSMKNRCYSPKHHNYPNYGGRGITVCEEWLGNVEQFMKDMGPRPEGMTLDRMDVNENYCKENCRWSTDIEQHNNRRDNLFIPYNGETKTVAEWARHLGVTYKKIYKRLKRGYAIEDIFNVENYKRSVKLKTNDYR